MAVDLVIGCFPWPSLRQLIICCAPTTKRLCKWQYGDYDCDCNADNRYNKMTVFGEVMRVAMMNEAKHADKVTLDCPSGLGKLLGRHPV